MEDQVDEIFLSIENKLTRKMKDENKKLENNILKTWNFRSENSLNHGYTGPCVEAALDGGDVVLVQSTSRGLDSDQENIDSEGPLEENQTEPHDRGQRPSIKLKVLIIETMRTLKIDLCFFKL